MAEPTAPEGTYVSVGEHRMYVIDEGAGEPVVFLHGGGPGANGWVDFGMMLPFFSDRRCVIPDLLTYGRSDLVQHSEPMWSFHARAIDQLMSTLGIESAPFVCSSVGGSAALALAVEYPQRVQRIVLSASNPTFDMPGLEGPNPGGTWIQRYYEGGPTWQKAKDLMADLEYWDPALIPDSTVTERYENTIRPEWLELVRHQATTDTRQDLEPVLRDIKAPVLLLYGKGDVIAPTSYALWLCNQIPGAELFVMDRTRHHPEEERPADYARIVRAWLKFDDKATGP
jgi:pimeloyl-ACP methyl ester carboxylesterase